MSAGSWLYSPTVRMIVKYGITTAMGGRKRSDNAQLRTKARSRLDAGSRVIG